MFAVNVLGVAFCEVTVPDAGSIDAAAVLSEEYTQVATGAIGRQNWSSSVTEKTVEPDGAEIVAELGDNVTDVRIAGFNVNTATALDTPPEDAVMFAMVGVLTANPVALPLASTVTAALSEDHVNVG